MTPPKDERLLEKQRAWARTAKQRRNADLKAAGLVRVTDLWVRPEDVADVRAFDQRQTVPTRPAGRPPKDVDTTNA